MKTLKSLSIVALIAMLFGLIIPQASASSLLDNIVYLPAVIKPSSSGSSGNPPPSTTPIPQPQGDPFTFVNWGDTKRGTDVLASLSKMVKQQNPAFTLYNGDLENEGFSTSGSAAWKTAINGNANNGIFDITFPIRGNHDYKNLSGWQTFFNTDGIAQRIGATNFTVNQQDISYAFDYKNSVFIGLDVLGDALYMKDEQIAFLDKALTAAEGRGIANAFIFFHGPIYPVANHNECPTRVCTTPPAVVNIVKVLNKHPIVAAVFQGHEHLQAYVHVDSSRVPEVTQPFEQLIIGAAGAGPNLCDQPVRFDYCGSYHGFATISVSGKNFAVKIYQDGNSTPVKTYNFTNQ